MIRTCIYCAQEFHHGPRDEYSPYSAQAPLLETVLESELAVQGLELDWIGVCWDGDFYHDHLRWVHQAFKGTRWQSVNDQSKRLYLKNAYRVLLTRARQGMIIFVPKSDGLDHTRPPFFYDGTFDYLRSCGIPLLG